MVKEVRDTGKEGHCPLCRAKQNGAPCSQQGRFFFFLKRHSFYFSQFGRKSEYDRGERWVQVSETSQPIPAPEGELCHYVPSKMTCFLHCWHFTSLLALTLSHVGNAGPRAEFPTQHFSSFVYPTSKGFLSVWALLDLPSSFCSSSSAALAMELWPPSCWERIPPLSYSPALLALTAVWSTYYFKRFPRTFELDLKHRWLF